jgi:hypothetical protein
MRKFIITEEEKKYIKSLYNLNKNLIIDETIREYLNENENFIYTDADYERYLSLEKDIVLTLNDIFPNDKYHFFASTWYRRSHENDKDLIFQEMHISSKSISGYSVKIDPLSKNDKEVIINTINDLIKKYDIRSVKIVIDDKNRRVFLEKFKDSKIKKLDKGRGSFEYPINNRKIKFIISDRDLVPFSGVKSLKNIYNHDESLTIDGAYKIVSYLSSHLYKFIKIDDDIFNLNDVEKEYVKFFQDTRDTRDNDTQDNVGTKDIMFKKYILNKLKTYNDFKELSDLFDMLETINFDFVYYDSINILSGKHYVRNI